MFLLRLNLIFAEMSNEWKITGIAVLFQSSFPQADFRSIKLWDNAIVFAIHHVLLYFSYLNRRYHKKPPNQ